MLALAWLFAFVVAFLGFVLVFIGLSEALVWRRPGAEDWVAFGALVFLLGVFGLVGVHREDRRQAKQEKAEHLCISTQVTPSFSCSGGRYIHGRQSRPLQHSREEVRMADYRLLVGFHASTDYAYTFDLIDPRVPQEAIDNMMERLTGETETTGVYYWLIAPPVRHEEWVADFGGKALARNISDALVREKGAEEARRVLAEALWMLS